MFIQPWKLENLEPFLDKLASISIHFACLSVDVGLQHLLV